MYERKQNFQAAADLWRRRIEICSEKFGESHNITVLAYEELSRTTPQIPRRLPFQPTPLPDNGRTIEDLRKALEIHRNALGDAHDRTLSIHRMLWKELTRQQNWANEADSALRVYLAECETTLGSSHWRTLEALEELAGLSERRSEVNIASWLHLVNSCRQSLGEHHLHTLSACIHLDRLLDREHPEVIGVKRTINSAYRELLMNCEKSDQAAFEEKAHSACKELVNVLTCEEEIAKIWRELLDDYSRLNPQRSEKIDEIRCYLQGSLLQAGNYEEATLVFLERLDQNDVDRHVKEFEELVETLVQNSQSMIAEKVTRAYVDFHQEGSEPWFNYTVKLAHLIEEHGKVSEAVDILKRISSTVKFGVYCDIRRLAYYELASLLQRHGMVTELKEMRREELRDCEKLPMDFAYWKQEARRRLGITLTDAGEYSEAEFLWTDWLAKLGEHVSIEDKHFVDTHISELWSRCGKLSQAEAMWTDRLVLIRDYPEAIVEEVYMNLAQVKQKQDNLDGAESTLTEYIALEGSEKSKWKACKRLAALHLERGLLEKATIPLRKLCSTVPVNPKNHDLKCYAHSHLMEIQMKQQEVSWLAIETEIRPWFVPATTTRVSTYGGLVEHVHCALAGLTWSLFKQEKIQEIEAVVEAALVSYRLFDKDYKEACNAAPEEFGNSNIYHLEAAVHKNKATCRELLNELRGYDGSDQRQPNIRRPQRSATTDGLWARFGAPKKAKSPDAIPQLILTLGCPCIQRVLNRQTMAAPNAPEDERNALSNVVGFIPHGLFQPEKNQDDDVQPISPIHAPVYLSLGSEGVLMATRTDYSSHSIGGMSTAQDASILAAGVQSRTPHVPGDEIPSPRASGAEVPNPPSAPDKTIRETPATAADSEVTLTDPGKVQLQESATEDCDGGASPPKSMTPNSCGTLIACLKHSMRAAMRRLSFSKRFRRHRKPTTSDAVPLAAT